MKRSRKAHIDPNMESIDQFKKHFDDIFQTAYNAIDVPSMSLFEVICNLKESKIPIDAKLVQIVIQNKLDHHFATCNCPDCNNLLTEKYTQQRELSTTIGEFILLCPYLHCSNCNSYHTPYEDALNLKRGKYQHDVQKIAARMAASETFEETAEMLNSIYNLGISPDTVHSLTNDLADEVKLVEIIPTCEDVAKIIEKLSEDNFRRPIFVFAADGAMVPIRSEEPKTPNIWKEARGLRGYLIDDNQIIHILSWHQITSKQNFLDHLHEIKSKNIIPEGLVRLCFIGDGAQWIWDLVNEVFPECRQVLDYYHCAEHLHDFAKAHFGDGKGSEWVEATKARLFHNNVAQVIAGLKRMKCHSQDALKNRDNLVNYLTNNKDRIDYGKCRRGGYPIGSGAIESANKFISHVRLKRSGAWWKVNYANNILKLRCSRYNSKYDECFENYEKNEKEKRLAKR